MVIVRRNGLWLRSGNAFVTNPNCCCAGVCVPYLSCPSRTGFGDDGTGCYMDFETWLRPGLPDDYGLTCWYFYEALDGPGNPFTRFGPYPISDTTIRRTYTAAQKGHQIFFSALFCCDGEDGCLTPEECWELYGAEEPSIAAGCCRVICNADC